jgi:hypothetical protein
MLPREPFRELSAQQQLHMHAARHAATHTDKQMRMPRVLTTHQPLACCISLLHASSFERVFHEAGRA